MTTTRRLARASAFALALVVAHAASFPAQAADEKAAKKPKLKKNEAIVTPAWAAIGVTSITLAPVRSLAGDEQALRLTRSAIEHALHDRGFKVFPAGNVLSTIDRDGTKGAYEAAIRAFEGEAALDSVNAAALGSSFRTDALFIANLNQWQRYVVDEYTRGASFTQVGIDGTVFSLKDGTVLWRGSFQEKMDGPYNEPQRGDLDARDPGRNSQKKADLEPPLFEEVLDKLMLRTTNAMPKPKAAAGGDGK